MSDLPWSDPASDPIGDVLRAADHAKYLNAPPNPKAAIDPETCEHPWDSVHYVDEQGVDTVRCGRCNVVLAVHAVDHDFQPPTPLRQNP